MEILLLGVAVITLVYLLFTLLECMFGFNSMVDLKRQPLLTAINLPSISIIFSALNEEKILELTLNQLVSLNYPNLEIIVINDRSTDNTANILEKFSTIYPNKIHVFHLQHLPNGWLGKNHALHFAAQHAKGDWLLFTDADVLFKDPVINHALHFALQKNLDHLTIFEQHLPKQFWLKILLLGSYITYSMEVKPWRIRYSWSKKYLGHGAFNLVKKTAYLDCGGHASIAMECLDDMELGHLLKSNGYKQDVAIGRDFIEREWYSSLKEMIKGLQKNSFAHFKYKLHVFLRDVIFALLLFGWPILAVFCCQGSVQIVNLINVILTLLLSAYVASHFRVKKRYAFFYPAAISMLLYTVCNSVVSAYKNKGIIWRGTHYSLELLRKKIMDDA